MTIEINTIENQPNRYISSIIVKENGVLEVRESIEYFDNNAVLLYTKFHRTTFCPGDDVTQEDEQIRTVAEKTWTTECISKFNEQRKQ